MKNKIDTGGPAMPVKDITFTDCPGMTLRDYFAAKAMQSVIAHSELVDEDGNFNCGPAPGTPAIFNFVQFAYLVADAMLAARKGDA